MSVAPGLTTALDHRFASALPEMAVSWQGAEAPDPRLLVLDERLAAEVGLDPAWLRSADGLQLLVGRAAPEGAEPVAQAYSGHQFGSFNPRLGDGRALLLGELTTPDGELRDLHLKGSGRTPFARGGDGYAVVGPMLREHVVSAAMRALGIPTSQALAVVATGRTVLRETPQPGAVLARIATSHLRVGSFQYARATGDADLLRRLADHAIARHHPDVATSERPYLALLEAVIAAQASLVASWMLVGFVHGVMNTDNITISGETIDYGPCAFLDVHDPATVFSSIDQGGRYAYGNQPMIMQWNLARLAEAMLPLLHEDDDQAIALATEALECFPRLYVGAWANGMRGKLGLPAHVDAGTVQPVMEGLLALMQQHRADHTGTFRALAGVARGDAAALDLPGAEAWSQEWLALSPDADAMDRVNPLYIPRNHLVEEALAAATAGDLTLVEQLVDVVSSPYDERPGLERYAAPAPETFGTYQTFCGT